MSEARAEIDHERMVRDRRARVVGAFGGEDASALLLLGQSNVRYATGAAVLQADAAHAALERAVALLVAGDDTPHLFTPWPDGVPDDVPVDPVHAACYPESMHGAAALVAQVAELAGPTGRLLVDEIPSALLGPLTDAATTRRVDDAAPLLARVRATKTADEIECIRRSQLLNEDAINAVRPIVHAGTATRDLSAELLARAIELGAESCVVEPIWQVMPASAAMGPPTVKGGPAFPLASDDTLVRGDVLWVDTGFSYAGYHSDFGRTWTVDTDPDRVQRAQFCRWRDVVAAVCAATRPGTTGRDLTAAAIDAAGGEVPWLAHLYLAHGIGMNSAETPLLGTDLGAEHDAAVVLGEGMVFVLEPVIWTDGRAGYRSEEVVAVTADGCELLSTYTYEPYG